jgi:hypothetical protein
MRISSPPRRARRSSASAPTPPPLRSPGHGRGRPRLAADDGLQRRRGLRLARTA